MKKLIVLFVILCSVIPLLSAADGPNQHLSPTEFRSKQKTYIAEKAELTKEEAANFFPLYFELQDKKKVLNDKVWSLIREGKEDNVTEAQYDEIMEGIYESRIASNRLDKTYFEKFRKILPAKKLYLIQKAEMRFHRDLLKGIQRGKDAGDRASQGKR